MTSNRRRVADHANSTSPRVVLDGAAPRDPLQYPESVLDYALEGLGNDPKTVVGRCRRVLGKTVAICVPTRVPTHRTAGHLALEVEDVASVTGPCIYADDGLVLFNENSRRECRIELATPNTSLDPDLLAVHASVGRATEQGHLPAVDPLDPAAFARRQHERVRRGQGPIRRGSGRR